MTRINVNTKMSTPKAKGDTTTTGADEMGKPGSNKKNNSTISCSFTTPEPEETNQADFLQPPPLVQRRRGSPDEKKTKTGDCLNGNFILPPVLDVPLQGQNPREKRKRFILKPRDQRQQYFPCLSLACSSSSSWD